MIQGLLHLFKRSVERLQQRCVNADLARIRAGVLVGDKYIQMAAAQIALVDSGAQHIFQKSKVLGKPE